VDNTMNTPTTPAELASFLLEHLSLTIPDAPLIPTNAAPFDYICHAFFEPSMHAAPLPCDTSLAASPTTPPTTPRDCVVWANRGGGKTFLGALATLLDLVFKPGIEIRILAGSREQAQRMHSHLRRFLLRPTFAPLVAGRSTDSRVTMANGSRVEVLAQSDASIRGTRVQKLRCDEVDLFKPEFWEAAQLVTRSATCGDIRVQGCVECLSTMHRPHGVMRAILADATRNTRRLFRWGVVDTLETCVDRACETCDLLDDCAGRAKSRTTAGFLTISDAITLKRRVSTATWNSEMLCQRPRRTNAVYPEFDPTRHVIAPDSEHAIEIETRIRRREIALCAGLDFGYRAPTAILYAALDHDGVLTIIDERVKVQTTVSSHAQAIREGLSRDWPIPEWIGVDPAGHAIGGQTGTSPVDDLKAVGLNIKTNRGAINAGLELVRARLDPASGEPRLRIHARCTHLIECLERYHFPEDNPESITPVKDGSDHAADALRYMIMCIDKPIKTNSANYANGFER
jgi:hypothetical protein